MSIEHPQEIVLMQEIASLRSAMESRAVIEQAKGVLMAAYQVDADRAFAILTRWSMQTNVKIRDLVVPLIAICLDDNHVGDRDATYRAIREAMDTSDPSQRPRLHSVT